MFSWRIFQSPDGACDRRKLCRRSARTVLAPGTGSGPNPPAGDESTYLIAKIFRTKDRKGYSHASCDGCSSIAPGEFIDHINLQRAIRRAGHRSGSSFQVSIRTPFLKAILPEIFFAAGFGSG